MGIDFENKPLKDDDGSIVKTANGKPVLYKHFLDDLPDPEHEIYSNMTATERLAYCRRLGIEPSPAVVKAAQDDADDQ